MPAVGLEIRKKGTYHITVGFAAPKAAEKYRRVYS
nr:MAG TPA: hypothetical protein [Caudoviricetes sp.]